MSLILKRSEEITNYTGDLNPNQLEAVNHKNGPLLIIAGAGSGKTRVLTHRIAKLIETGVEPWCILALTFTNKAAREMKERIGKIISVAQADRIWSGTFHSIFARILRIEADKIGYTSNFSIYDADDSLSLIKSIMTSLEISIQQFSPQAIRSVISGSKNKLITPKDFIASAERVFEKHAGNVYFEYQKQLKANNAMDFDDLLIKVIELFDKSQPILEHYQQKFKYILVDEYQDTNRAQYIVLKQLAKAHQNICVVGDDAQSIYKWRGADVQNILDFQKDYPYAKTVKLEQNYRSTSNIISAADSLISNNRNQLKKKLWTQNPEGEKIKVFSLADDRNEADKIVKTLNSELANKDYKDFAILYRTNAQSLTLENTLRQNGIPYVIYGGQSFFKRKEIKDTIAYLRLLTNPNDGESLKRVINEPPRGIGKTSLEHLSNYANANLISLYQSFAQSELNQNLQKRAIKSSKSLIALIDEYRERIINGNDIDSLKSYISETGLIEMYEEIGTQDAEDRLNNINQLLTDILQFIDDNQGADLDDYLQQTSLASDFDEDKSDGNRVTLMTLHSAKGLEFPIVFIAGLEQGLFPLIRSEFDKDEEEEERRLMYVGITRAMEKLVITFCKRRMKFGEISYQLPSIFLKEIDSKYVDFPDKPKVAPVRTEIPRGLFDKGTEGKSLKDRFSGSSKENYSQIPEFEESYSQISDDVNTLKVGDKVHHAQFGEGQIAGLKGEGNRRQAVVRFKSVGRKMLMLKFAKLKKLS